MELIRRETDYAIRALVAIALADRFVTAADIARECDVPVDFLHKILRKLKTAGILAAKRGVAGGFTLSQGPREVSLFDIAAAIQGPPALNYCLVEDKSCTRSRTCSVRKKFLQAQNGLHSLFREIKLEELIRETS